MSNFGIVIPTKDRFISLCRTLDRLTQVNRVPIVVVVVDASDDAMACRDAFLELRRPVTFKLDWIKSLKAGTSIQRNMGIKHIQDEYSDIDWVMLLDDDLIFQDACFDSIHFEELCRDTLWFALPTEHREAESKMKRFGNAVCRKLGLYPEPGKIAPSGFQAPIDPDNPEHIEWAPTALMLFYVGQQSNFNFFQFFSEAFTGYGYLEDLEMSVRLKSTNLGFGVLDVKICHPIVIRDSVAFGEMEVRNRLRVVRALPDASMGRFGSMMCLRIVKSFYEAVIGLYGAGRFAGSLRAFLLLVARIDQADRLEEEK